MIIERPIVVSAFTHPTMIPIITATVIFSRGIGTIMKVKENGLSI